MTLVACAIIHERDKLKAIGFEQVKPTILYTDSQSSVDLCKTLRSKENTKHVNVRINFLRECVNNRIIEIVFIETDLMVADLLTKPLANNIFNELKYKLLYGFGGNAENIGRHFTPMEQVYREIDLHDAVLVGQIRTRINLIKNNSLYGIDYSETYSPTTLISIIFMLMHIGASLNLFTAIFDVTAAFLEGTNDFKQYCWLPKELGLDGIHKLRVEIIKALYGEKQARKIWSDLLHSILTKMGFHRYDVVPCLYIRGTPDSDDYMLVCAC